MCVGDCNFVVKICFTVQIIVIDGIRIFKKLDSFNFIFDKEIQITVFMILRSRVEFNVIREK